MLLWDCVVIVIVMKKRKNRSKKKRKEIRNKKQHSFDENCSYRHRFHIHFIVNVTFLLPLIFCYHFPYYDMMIVIVIRNIICIDVNIIIRVNQLLWL